MSGFQSYEDMYMISYASDSLGTTFEPFYGTSQILVKTRTPGSVYDWYSSFCAENYMIMKTKIC